MANIIGIHLNGMERIEKKLDWCEKVHGEVSGEDAEIRGYKFGQDTAQKFISKSMAMLEDACTIEYDNGSEYIFIPVFSMIDLIDAYMGEE